MVRNASDHDVDAFAALPEGADAVSAWRGRANRNVAIVRQRVNRIFESMDDESIVDALFWFSALPPAAMTAIFKTLAR